MSTGAFSLVDTARRAGVEVCFANPGTTELPIVVALERVPGMRVVLGLFEGVCTGAADGWARMTGRPAATLLHLGPGFANGLANLHNARRARTPVVNWIGEHPVRHLAFDAPLTSDIAALANSVGWTRIVKSAPEMAEASFALFATRLELVAKRGSRAISGHSSTLSQKAAHSRSFWTPSITLLPSPVRNGPYG